MSCKRFATAVSLAKEADVVIVDEPSSFLDIKQRVAMAASLRQYVAEHDNYMIAVEHDLAVLDYLSDNVCVLTGEATAYGAVSAPFAVGDGIKSGSTASCPLIIYASVMSR